MRGDYSLFAIRYSLITLAYLSCGAAY
jgi:hypothetical protein